MEMLAGDLDGAEVKLRRAHDALVALGEKYLLSSVAGLLAQTLLDRDAPLAEVEALGEQSRELATPDDVDSQSLWRCVRARVLARHGSFAEAEALVREALDSLGTTDATLFQLRAQLDYAEILTVAGRRDEARVVYDAARELAERKGGVVILGTVFRRLEQLDAAPRSP